MSPTEDKLKRFEEEKRDAAWDPVERWRMILRAITWAESLPNVRRNTPQRCHELEQAKLAETESRFQDAVAACNQQYGAALKRLAE